MKKKNIAVGIIFFTIGYVIGIFTGHYRIFPFDLIFTLKKEIGIGENKKRYLNVSNMERMEVAITKKTGIYLTYGQSNSANHGQIGYKVKNDVYQFYDYTVYGYQDPSLGASGDAGSVWGMVGDKLILQGIHDKVIFSNNGWQGKSIKELNTSPYFSYLLNSYNQLINKYGRVDAILFHQGEINHKSKYGNENYYKEFHLFLKKLQKEGIEIPIYLSRTSICNTGSDRFLTGIQSKIINDFEMVYEGPDTDKLFDSKYRLPDNCHFSMLGFEKFSDMWVKSIMRKQ
ncbi:sialate O-acetylesterase [Christiangramia aquimixticola]|uniref:sialate O-acetylesterase n=1 Tax=Christiangramia aquimixticola TaxID=1697558 RepID=UPI003AA965DB